MPGSSHEWTTLQTIVLGWLGFVVTVLLGIAGAVLGGLVGSGSTDRVTPQASSCRCWAVALLFSYRKAALH